MIVTLISESTGPTVPAVERLAKMLADSKASYRLVDADSPEGIALARLYDVTRRPAVVVTQNDGVLVQLWQGQLPSADELGYTSHS